MPRISINVLKDGPFLNNIQVQFDFFPKKKKNSVDPVLSQACYSAAGVRKVALRHVLLPWVRHFHTVPLHYLLRNINSYGTITLTLMALQPRRAVTGIRSTTPEYEARSWLLSHYIEFLGTLRIIMLNKPTSKFATSVRYSLRTNYVSSLEVRIANTPLLSFLICFADRAS